MRHGALLNSYVRRVVKLGPSSASLGRSFSGLLAVDMKSIDSRPLNEEDALRELETVHKSTYRDSNEREQGVRSVLDRSPVTDYAVDHQVAIMHMMAKMDVTHQRTLERWRDELLHGENFTNHLSMSGLATFAWGFSRLKFMDEELCRFLETLLLHRRPTEEVVPYLRIVCNAFSKNKHGSSIFWESAIRLTCQAMELSISQEMEATESPRSITLDAVVDTAYALALRLPSLEIEQTLEKMFHFIEPKVKKIDGTSIARLFGIIYSPHTESRMSLLKTHTLFEKLLQTLSNKKSFKELKFGCEDIANLFMSFRKINLDLRSHGGPPSENLQAVLNLINLLSAQVSWATAFDLRLALDSLAGMDVFDEKLCYEIMTELEKRHEKGEWPRNYGDISSIVYYAANLKVELPALWKFAGIRPQDGTMSLHIVKALWSFSSMDIQPIFFDKLFALDPVKLSPFQKVAWSEIVHLIQTSDKLSYAGVLGSTSQRKSVQEAAISQYKMHRLNMRRALKNRLTLDVQKILLSKFRTVRTDFATPLGPIDHACWYDGQEHSEAGTAVFLDLGEGHQRLNVWPQGTLKRTEDVRREVLRRKGWTIRSVNLEGLSSEEEQARAVYRALRV